MQNVRTQTWPFPSRMAIAGALFAIGAAIIMILYFSAQSGHQSTTTSSAPGVTKSAGSELAAQNASERNGVVDQQGVVTRSFGSELVQQNASERSGVFGEQGSVTRSAGSELVQHNTSERSGVPDQPAGQEVRQLHGPR